MQVKRFIAADMRRALELVRQEMGADAVILSSQRHPKGVELLTTLEDVPRVPDEVQGLVPSEDSSAGDESPLISDAAWGDQAAVNEAVKAHFDARTDDPAGPIDDSAIQTAFAGRTSRQLADEIEQARERMFSARKAEAEQEEAPTLQKPFAPAGVRSNVQAPEPKNPADDSALLSMQEELSAMRALLHEQLGRMNYGQMAAHSPVQASVWRQLNNLGLSSHSSDQVLQAIATKDYQTAAEAWPAAMAALAHQVPTVDYDVADQGGVIALVGPTGAGKTTTIGKLAARYVLKHGADKVALVTTDTYRLAAHDQLRSLGRILNVTVKVVGDEIELPGVLKSLSHCSLVLIDTAGFRHGDPLLAQQLKALRQESSVSSYLVLSCNSQQQMMKASLSAYKLAGLRGCVLTKLDETTSLGEAIGVIAESGLPLAYTTDGQQIPNDIALARAHQLVTRAVSIAAQNPQDEPKMFNGFASVAETVPQSPLARATERL